MKRILVVDDEPTIRELIAEFLREWGYHVETAVNGAEALQRMRRRLPDVIVLDLMMPLLDATGFVELKRLKPRFDSVPVLLVTAAFGAAEAGQRLGAHAWLAKPFELDDLVNAVERLIGDPEAMSAAPGGEDVDALRTPVSAESSA
jgi:CheY-like chemotaxis protein